MKSSTTTVASCVAGPQEKTPALTGVTDDTPLRDAR